RSIFMGMQCAYKAFSCWRRLRHDLLLPTAGVSVNVFIGFGSDEIVNLGFQAPVAKALAVWTSAKCVAGIEDKLLVATVVRVQAKFECIFRSFHLSRSSYLQQLCRCLRCTRGTDCKVT